MFGDPAIVKATDQDKNPKTKKELSSASAPVKKLKSQRSQRNKSLNKFSMFLV